MVLSWRSSRTAQNALTIKSVKCGSSDFFYYCDYNYCVLPRYISLVIWFYSKVNTGHRSGYKHLYLNLDIHLLLAEVKVYLIKLYEVCGMIFSISVYGFWCIHELNYGVIFIRLIFRVEFKQYIYYTTTTALIFIYHSITCLIRYKLYPVLVFQKNEIMILERFCLIRISTAEDRQSNTMYVFFLWWYFSIAAIHTTQMKCTE